MNDGHDRNNSGRAGQHSGYIAMIEPGGRKQPGSFWCCSLRQSILLIYGNAYVSTAVRIDPKSALSFAATSVQSAFHFKFTYSRLVRDLIKSMSLFRMALVSNQSGSLFYDYFTT